LPLVEDGARRDQRLHRGGPGRLRLDAGRGRGRDAAGRPREPGAALSALGDQVLGAVPAADRDPPGPPRGRRRPHRQAEGLMRRAALALGLVALLAWPWASPRYFVFLASLSVVNAIVAIGLNLLSGYTNQLSFGVVMVLAALNLARTRTGRALLAIRESEIAAQASGVHLARYKTLAFAISAVYTGVAGGLFAFVVGFLSPDAFDVFLSVDYVAMIIVGGLGSVPGSIAGAALLTVLNDSLAGFQSYRPLIFGTRLSLSLLFMPGGVARAFRFLKGEQG